MEKSRTEAPGGSGKRYSASRSRSVLLWYDCSTLVVATWPTIVTSTR